MRACERELAQFDALASSLEKTETRNLYEGQNITHKADVREKVFAASPRFERNDPDWPTAYCFAEMTIRLHGELTQKVKEALSQERYATAAAHASMLKTLTESKAPTASDITPLRLTAPSDDSMEALIWHAFANFLYRLPVYEIADQPAVANSLYDSYNGMYRAQTLGRLGITLSPKISSAAEFVATAKSLGAPVGRVSIGTPQFSETLETWKDTARYRSLTPEFKRYEKRTRVARARIGEARVTIGMFTECSGPVETTSTHTRQRQGYGTPVTGGPQTRVLKTETTTTTTTTSAGGCFVTNKRRVAEAQAQIERYEADIKRIVDGEFGGRVPVQYAKNVRNIARRNTWVRFPVQLSMNGKTIEFSAIASAVGYNDGSAQANAQRKQKAIDAMGPALAKELFLVWIEQPAAPPWLPAIVGALSQAQVEEEVRWWQQNRTLPNTQAVFAWRGGSHDDLAVAMKIRAIAKQR